MGLDSVELLCSIEETFGISIPDKESEHIYTIQQLALAVQTRLTFSKTSKKDVFLDILNRLETSIVALKIDHNTLSLDKKISEWIAPHLLIEHWNDIERELGLTLPNLVELYRNPELDSHVKFLGFKTIKRSRPVTMGTLRQLVDWIISLNFKHLIDVRHVSNLYEIERVICGMTSEKMGIPINEIEVKHSFSSDLGID